MDHHAVQDVAFTDKIGDKSVGRFIINRGRRSGLLDLSFTHHHNRIAQGQRFFLVVGHIDERDPEAFVHSFDLHLHILPHFQVERGQRFVKEKYLGLIHNSPGNSHPLLLPA